MKYLQLIKEDEELIEAAAQVIKRNYVRGRHHVGAAVRMRSGRVYTGVHMESRVHDICAEPVALGTAATHGEREIDTIVAVTVAGQGVARVLSPCGTCRELISFYGPEARVLFVEDGEVKKCLAKDLLPGPFVNSSGS